MSLKKDTRRIAKALNVPYTKAQSRILQSRPDAKKVVDEYSTTWSQALHYTIVERPAADNSRYLGESACRACGGPNAYGIGKKGDYDPYHADFCPRCRQSEAVECDRCGEDFVPVFGESDSFCEDCESQWDRFMEKD